MGILVALFTVFLIWISSNIWTICHNYFVARSSGLPIVICLTNPDNYIWMIASVPLRPFLEKYMPSSIMEFITPSIYGWEFRDKYALHKKVGPVFLLVTPGTIELWIADPEVASIVLNRRKDFVQLPIASKIMRLLGENIITSDGNAWARQRRLIAPNLNERISQVVWDESITQATTMSQYLFSEPNGESKSTIAGLHSIAINVLGQAGYGQPQHWSAGEKVTNRDGKMDYFEVVSRIIHLLVPAAILPSRLLKMTFMPEALRKVGQAMDEYPEQTNKLLEKERLIATESGEERSNLLAMLARLSDPNNKDPAAPSLSPEEVQRNLFLFTAAGFDTTAGVMSYAVTLLAANPKWQNWIFEELDRVLPTSSTIELDYKIIFPKLSRCLALMLETLRIFSPVIHISRSIKVPQTIRTRDHTYYIPGPAKVHINNVCLHTKPSHWGPNSLSFNPERWITSVTFSSYEFISENIMTPEKGTYSPWSGGPRICPGQKMSQVEFVAVIATLFS